MIHLMSRFNNNVERYWVLRKIPFCRAQVSRKRANNYDEFLCKVYTVICRTNLYSYIFVNCCALFQQRYWKHNFRSLLKSIWRTFLTVSGLFMNVDKHIISCGNILSFTAEHVELCSNLASSILQSHDQFHAPWSTIDSRRYSTISSCRAKLTP